MFLKRSLCLCLGLVLINGFCSVSHPVKRVGGARATLHQSHYQSFLLSSRSAICQTAKAQLGKPYSWGDEDPETGFDCSGLSQFVYAQQGIEIPRTALQQYQALHPVKTLKEGDLVFFRTHSHSTRISHVGIYIGQGYFVHSPRTGEDIRIDRLNDPYWHKHYAGARRVLTPHQLAARNSKQELAFN